MEKIYIALIIVTFFTCSSCDLQQIPKDSPSAEEVFSHKSELQLYVNSFYNIVPGGEGITHGDAMSDYVARRSVPDLLSGALNPSTVGEWSWSNLRGINYFLQHNHDPNIPKSVRENYNGIARFFRAWFYLKKVKRYGKVPWINEPLDINSKKLRAPRDPRTLVMDSVLADINFAISHIKLQRDPSRTGISKDVALALKSRIALFEGTYREYHPELGLKNTVDKWLKACVKASKKIMNSGVYNVYEGSGVAHSYRKLFTSKKPIKTSVLLADVFSTDLSVTHDANWWYTSGTYGVRLSFIRPFINTYLMREGTPFTDIKGYKTMTFTEETKDRDTRLQQTIRMPNHTRTNQAGKQVPAPPDFAYTLTGYQPIKWTLPKISLDGDVDNTNSVPVFRYAEILLNYAEAKAELGTITNDDWNETIGELRRRAGITSGTRTLPTKVDPYLQKTYFPNISNPVILEIRRCRGIELALEGFRFDDIRRWGVGNLMEMKWKGIYVPSTNSYVDLTGDNKPDVYFYTSTIPQKRKTGVQYIRVGSKGILSLINGNSGNLVVLSDAIRKWSPKKYLYPLSVQDLHKNPNLKQNPGW